MKKFKKIKSITPFEGLKLTKEQMYGTTGGRPIVILGFTFGTVSICHKDGAVDAD